MLDFLMITHRSRKGEIEIYPKFIIGKSKDLMIRGGDFYAVWLEEKGSWSTNEQDLIDAIDQELRQYAEINKSKFEDSRIRVMYMWDSDSGMIDSWHKYCQKQMRDNYKELDTKIIFSNQTTKKSDYSSKTLSYPLEEGVIDNYDELMSVLYSDEERKKIEWAIGAVVTGESKKIHKFVVLYGPPGTGKSTVLDVIELLFDGYSGVFDAESLGSSTATFALEQFKANPLVGISHDGDLSRIEKNTVLNSLVAHERMTINEKHRPLYSMKINTFLFMGTNKPVKITDAKSGIIRRLIDVKPTGNKVSVTKYNRLRKGISFELGAIAYKCMNVFLENPTYYDDYVPMLMLGESNDFYNFIEDSYSVFKKQDGVTLKQAWEMYKNYCEDARVPYPMSMRAFRTELKNYFYDYKERVRVGENWMRSYYIGFKTDLLDNEPEEYDDSEVIKNDGLIKFKKQHSAFDVMCKDNLAQYANDKELPFKKWNSVKTVLEDIDTSKLHYVQVPENHIVIDFDLKDKNGNKSFEKNLAEASKWPKTYAELSKSGGGIHLHYIYTGGDPTLLSRIYSDDIEVKVFTGNSSLRRKLTKCNNEPINTINSGLPQKEEGKIINFKAIANERALRTLIRNNLNKEYHGATKPSVDFIFESLENAYNSGIIYDVSDMRNVVLAFAASSTNQADTCIKTVAKMHWKSETESETRDDSKQPIIFFDVECFPNLFLINWKKLGSKTLNHLINPEPKDIQKLFRYRLVGFNNRRYDNHMIYAAGFLGYSNEELYKLSQNIIVNQRGFFREAYNISYTDIYDYASKKQSLKKWEIELGMHHQELGFPWDKPVPEEKWIDVANYCDNDVLSTEAVWFATQADFTARMILADLAGMSVNDTTNSLTTKIIFGNDKKPELNYVDLSEEFPGYEFKKVWNDTTKRFDKYNMYRGIDLGFGGYVYSEPGMYGNVALLDVESLHPNSIINMNLFGKYTSRFKAIVDIRIHIKHNQYDLVRNEFEGRLSKYLDNEETASQLSFAMKIAINSVYGLTSATFDNPFRDARNENNIGALRGALFMKTLEDAVRERGFKVIHIKTDSIKIPDATPEIIQFCMEFAKKYKYTFKLEETYEKMCLVNDAVYIARVKDWEKLSDEQPLYTTRGWTAIGTQFQVPYVFKKCFSKEPIVFRDYCVTKEVKSSMHLDMNESLPENEHDYRFIGRVGLFCPIKPGKGGGELFREQKTKDGSLAMYSVTGTKGYRWLESETIAGTDREAYVDESYFRKLVDEAISSINKFGDFEWFSSDDPYTEYAGPLIIGGIPIYSVGSSPS